MNYITLKKKSEDCVFCAILNDDPERDRENYMVFRGQTTFTVLNIYPYNPGHLMILPREHVAILGEVPQAAQFEMMTLTSYFITLLSELIRPDGFNIGMNIGRAAGAGIDNHLHLHIVPRWNGDSNFMPVINDTRVLPEILDDTYDRIVEALRRNPPDKTETAS